MIQKLRLKQLITECMPCNYRLVQRVVSKIIDWNNVVILIRLDIYYQKVTGKFIFLEYIHCGTMTIYCPSPVFISILHVYP